MPFDHRLLDEEPAPQDDAGEIVFAAELTALADQLRAESDSLAARYPPGSNLPGSNLPSSNLPSSNLPSSNSISWKAGLSGLASALITMACVAMVICVPQLLQNPTLPAPASLTAPTPAANNVIVPMAAPSMELTPAAIAPYISSPELEGLIDVLENNPEQNCSISI